MQGLIVRQRRIPLESVALGLYCGHPDRAKYVITSEVEWVSLWNKLADGKTFQRSVPVVDFSKYMILAVFMGEYPTGGVQTRITSAGERSGKIVVAVFETCVDEGGEGPGWTAQPYHVVKAPSLSMRVDFWYK